MNSPSPIKVMIVDDHETVRRTVALSLLAYDDIQPVGEAANGLEAIALCRGIQPDVIIMDLRMPEMGGVAATVAIKERSPQVKVIALTNFKDEPLLEAALAVGVEAYLLKNISMDDLAATIRTVHAGPSGDGSRQRQESQQ